MPRIRGTFDVKLAPLPGDPSTGGDAIGRLSIDKQFHGDLDAHSHGQMIAHSTATPGSAGYVALEQVTGRLGGRNGSFVLQHSATMNRGAPQLTLTVVPDSGTGELAGLSGSMQIIIENKQHGYDFDYELKPA
jgi:hypothetical protein